MPWNQWLYTIAYIYELSQDLRTFTIEYPGACLSVLHCLEASLHRRFHFIEGNWCLHPPCAGIAYAIPQRLALPASPCPQIPRCASRWCRSQPSCPQSEMPGGSQPVAFLHTHGLQPRGSSAQGILQVRILEWTAISSSRGSSHPRD